MWVVIPSAGAGNRFSQSLAKQYWQVNGKTILEHAIERFIDFKWVDKIVVAIAPTDNFFHSLAISQDERVVAVHGAEQRSQSVLNALNYILHNAKTDDWVCVHDAVRPCLHPDDLTKLLSLTNDPVGGILAAPCVDTLKRTNDQHQIQDTLSRDNIWQALTPQMFRLQLLSRALLFAMQSGKTITDEASAIEYLGYQPKIVKAQFPNPKLTYQSDLKYISYLLSQEKIKESAI